MPERAEPTAREQIRLAAVALATDIDETRDDEPGDGHHRTPGHRIAEVLRIAERIYDWAIEPAPAVRLVARIGTPFPTPEGSIMANPQIPVGYSDLITIEPEDTLGNDVGDTLTWSSSNPDAATVTADTTTLIGTFSALTPATDVVITATDGTNTYEYTFDAVADTPVALIGTVGVPFKTPPAA